MSSDEADRHDPLRAQIMSDDDTTRFATEGLGADEFDLEFDDENDLRESAPGLVGVLGEYLLLDQIGVGGMGKVFRAEHRTMNREVALKVLSNEIASRNDILQQFFAEIRAVAKLMHPNIVTAFDAGSSGETHYLVMELVDGEILSSKVKRQGPLSAEEAVSILDQAGRALSYAHEMGIVHRDIKPSNMMLTTKGVLKILDFGLAFLGKKPDAGADQKRMFLGTPEFIAPEQVEDAESVDGRSDLYSLGATLYYLVTGQPMFRGQPMQVARAHLHEDPKALFEVRSDIDLRLDSVFQKLVAKNPDDRYASADEMLEHLAKLELGAETTFGSSLRKGAYRLAKDSPTASGFSASTVAQKSTVVGIDLGLLTTEAAYFDLTLGPQVIAQGDGHATFLRNMVWSSDRKLRFGSQAAELRQVEPTKIFHSVQRWLGAQQIQRPFGGRIVHPEVVLAAILKRVVNNCARLSEGSRSAVVTVPACYDQMHRRAIRNACQIAGIDLVQLLDKPLAAALGWMDVQFRLSRHSQSSLDERILVVQLSGTGLDASVVQTRGTTVRQLGTSGHWKLGLLRWQNRLVQYFTETLKEKMGRNIREDVAAATRLQRTVEIAMNQLSHSSKVEVRFDWQGTSIQQVVTQEGLIRVASDLTVSLQQSVATACQAARIEMADIDRVLLSGSMLQMKAVQKIITATLPKSVPVTWLEKGDLARGAAIQGFNIGTLGPRKGHLSPQAVGCTSHEIAVIAVSPGRKPKPRKLIEKGAAIPTSISRSIKQRPGSNYSISMLQFIESSSLGQGNWLKLGNLPLDVSVPQRGDAEKLKLDLSIDSSGILQSTIWANGQELQVPATSDPEMSPKEVEEYQKWLELIVPSEGINASL